MNHKNLLQMGVRSKNEFNNSFSPCFFFSTYALMLVCRYRHKTLYKPLCEEKPTDSTTYGGESKVLPHIFQRGFEEVLGFLHPDRGIEGKMPPKAFNNRGLRGSGSNQGVEKRYGISIVMIRTYSKGGWRKLFAMCICYKGLGNNSKIISHRKRKKNAVVMRV